MRRFEFVQGTSNKFWEIEVQGSTVTARWGRIGTNGQTKSKDHSTSAAADKDADKQISGKQKKGYVEVAATGAPMATSTPTPTPTPSPTPAPAAPIPTPAASVPTPAPAPAPPAAPPVPKGRPTLVPAPVPDEVLAELAPAPAPTPAPVEIPDDDSDPLADFPTVFVSNLAPFGPYYGNASRHAVNPSKASHAWKRARRVQADAIRKAQTAPRVDLASAVLELVAQDKPEAPAVDVAGALLALSDFEWPAVVDWLWGILGPERALVAGLCGERLSSSYDQKGVYYGNSKAISLEERTQFHTGALRSWAWIRFGQHVATLDPEERAAARRAVDAQRVGLGAAWTHAIAIAFRDPELAQSLLPNLKLLLTPQAMIPCHGSVSRVQQHAIADAMRGGWNQEEVRLVCFQVVEVLQVEAEPVLLALQKHYRPYAQEVVLRALSSIRSPAVMRKMVEILEYKEWRSIGERALAASPELALHVLAEVATPNGATLTDALFSSMVREDPDRARRMTRGPSRAKVEACLEVLVEAVDLGSLPAFFADPPWRKKTATSRVDDVIEVQSAHVPELLNGQPVTKVEGYPKGVAIHTNKWGGARLVADAGHHRPVWWPSPSHTNVRQYWTAGTVVRDFEETEQPDGRLCLKPWGKYGFHGPDFEDLKTSLLMWEFAVRLKKQKTARAWVAPRLADAPAHVLSALLPIALGKAKKTDRAIAQKAIATAAEGNREGLIEAAKAYPDAVQDALKRMIDVDPLTVIPAKPKSRPAWLDPAALPPLVLRDGGMALPFEAVDVVLDMLSFSRVDKTYAGLLLVRELCTPTSCAAFAWDLYQRWLGVGGEGKHDWCMLALGHFGDDSAALDLAKKIRVWPGESAHQRAVKGLDVLGAIGTDAALMQLHNISEKVKFKGLRARAKDRVLAIAEARGLTPDELGDRLVPDLGLDPNGSRVLDFGPRQFTVGFDEQLKPWVADSAGKKRANLPKPGVKDDAALADPAVATWKLLKKNARAIASTQVNRLERGMCAQRRWKPADFQAFMVDHPLIVHLSRRLVWGVWADGTLVSTFRVTEDRSLADAEDEPFDLPQTGMIGIPHALELDNAQAWGELFGDYELLQPFDQLARPALALTPDELTTGVLSRVSGVTVPWTKVKNLEKRGWISGEPQDAGCIWEYHKPLDDQTWAYLDLDPGLYAGGVEYNEPQKLGEIVLRKPNAYHWHKNPADRLWSAVHPVQASELLLDLQFLTAS